jgi:hypothetical protein
MATVIQSHRVLRWVVSSFIVTIGLAGGLIGSAPAVGTVVVHHGVAGTYQAFAPNLPGPFDPFTLVLLRNHTEEGSTSTWSVHKHIVTIEGSGGPAMPILCLEHQQPLGCVFNDVSTGPKTAAGIASQQAPGSATVYVGSAFLFSSPFWAVRTGKA